MAAQRKLQQEIDKVLKKIKEGVDVFDNLWEQMQASEYQNQREKFESELKKEIKKLQRFRDQVKTWQASSDVKDKKPLLEARKSVEREMERFKAAEREGKTKAFSKEGLIKAASLDPKSKARQEVRDWMNSTVDKLNSQIDELEAELEASGSSRKKKSSRVQEVEQYIARHKEHIQKLESLLRLLDNEQLEPDDFEDIRDFLDDYIERNQDDPEEFEDSAEYFYEEFADIMESAPQPTVLTAKKKDDKEDKKAKEKAEREKAEKEKAEREKEERERVAAAKAALAAEKAAKTKAAMERSSAPADAGDKRAQPASYAATGRDQPSSDASKDQGPRSHSSGGTTAAAVAAKHTAPGGMGSWNYGTQGLGAGAGAGTFPQAAASRIAEPLKGTAQQRDPRSSQPPPQDSGQQPSFAAPSALPAFRHNAHSIPQDQDRTWQGQAFRGKTAVKALADPACYERFDGETLFFAFYYQPGTYSQYLAAKALKKKNWRFNKRHNAWFQRLKEPQYVTAEHEQGSYIWFDYHMFHEDGSRGWRPRVKENFVFEYSDLENKVK